MMQYAGADHLIEAHPKLADPLERELADLQIVEFVLTLQLLSMLQAGCAEIDPGDLRCRPADGIFCGLRRTATGNQYGVALAVRPCWPEKVEVCPTPLGILPSTPIHFKVIDWRGDRGTGPKRPGLPQRPPRTSVRD
jgi:hypothetical protein